jgi:nucleoside 2-deoxyribosyltransferase
VDKRYQVFVSSTFTDLVEERRAVMQALLEQDCIPAGMELFVASDQNSWELIEGVIDDCDYYVVIVGARYGSLTDAGISFTEREYDYAVARGIPVLGFIHANPDKIEIGKGEKTDEGKEKLAAFIEKVRRKHVKTFASTGELAAVVGASIAREMKRAPGIGWVRGDLAMTPETAAEMSELRARIAELELGKVQADAEASSGLLADTSDLAQGDDEAEVPYDLGYSEYGRFEVTHEGSEDIPWDEIFKTLGPIMIDEANEAALRSRLNDLVLNRLAETDQLPDDIPGAPAVRVQDVVFDRIKVQFRALNLIDKGSKRRPVSDRQTYWRLTESGDRYLATLIAVRRKTDPSG